ncbi:MAG: hypothetical protein HQM06_05725 [Magnetococcales bacterium]|nr:hypothetical protein [Magnetococcales bacterium]
MAIAVTGQTGVPPRPLMPPIPSRLAARMTKKCHLLPTRCRACGVPMHVSYPGSVTYWQFACPACRKGYAIEIIDHRKCLVYEQQGRQMVERIGLTQQRQSFYRARCHGCGTILIAAEEQLQQQQKCHHCRLPFVLRPVHDEVYYETEINRQGQSALFRDRVQSLSGNIFNAGNLYFLDEDRLDRPSPEWAELLSRMESELQVLRMQGEGMPLLAEGVDEAERVAVTTEREQEEREALHRQWQQKLLAEEAQSQRLAERVRQLEEQSRQLEVERRAAAQRLAHYDEVIRYLDQQTAQATRLQNRVTQLIGNVEQLNREKEGLLNQLSGQSERIQLLETERCRQVAQLQYDHQLTQEHHRLQQENRLLTEKINSYAAILDDLQQLTERANRFETLYVDTALKLKQLKGENAQLTHRLSEKEESVSRLERQVAQASRVLPDGSSLESRLQALQEENQRLQHKARQQSRLEARVAELEEEIALLRRRGGESGLTSAGTSSGDEWWYGEEGEEWYIAPHEPGAEERRILGLKGEPTPERIKSALRKRIRQYHPDRVATLGKELREVAHRKTQEITRAYAQLMAIYGRR